MHKILEGIYKKGIIKLKKNPHLKDNSYLKILIIEQDYNKDKNIKFGSYKFPINLDKVNIREFAHED